MKPLGIDQQIQVCRVFGWLSLMIEGTSVVKDQHAFIVRAAKRLCPIVNLDDRGYQVDNLWELGGLPEAGIDGDDEAKKLENSLPELVAPLLR